MESGQESYPIRTVFDSFRTWANICRSSKFHENPKAEHKNTRPNIRWKDGQTARKAKKSYYFDVF